jgi:hypothetical protein
MNVEEKCTSIQRKRVGVLIEFAFENECGESRNKFQETILKRNNRRKNSEHFLLRQLT